MYIKLTKDIVINNPHTQDLSLFPLMQDQLPSFYLMHLLVAERGRLDMLLMLWQGRYYDLLQHQMLLLQFFVMISLEMCSHMRY